MPRLEPFQIDSLPARPARLIRLSDGYMIDPRHVRALEARLNNRPYVDDRHVEHHAQLVIETASGRVHRVPCPSLAEAEALRDRLASASEYIDRFTPSEPEAAT